MMKAADALEFEKAARYRNRIAALSAVSSSQDVNAQTIEEADVFAVAEQAASSASRCSSSACTRTGATGPSSPGPTPA